MVRCRTGKTHFKYGGLVAKSCPALATPWTVACQAPLSIGFSRQECRSGLPFPSLEELPDPGIKSGSPALQADSLPTELWQKPHFKCRGKNKQHSRWQWIQAVLCYKSNMHKVEIFISFCSELLERHALGSISTVLVSITLSFTCKRHLSSHALFFR